MSKEKKNKKKAPSDEQSQYVPYTQSYRVALEKAEKPKEDKKD